MSIDLTEAEALERIDEWAELSYVAQDDIMLGNAREALHKGIEHLDTFLEAHASLIDGDWRKLIDVDSLDISDCEACICGQISAAILEKNPALAPNNYLNRWTLAKDLLGVKGSGAALGFDENEAISIYDDPFDNYNYDALTRAWREYLDAQ